MHEPHKRLVHLALDRSRILFEKKQLLVLFVFGNNRFSLYTNEPAEAPSFVPSTSLYAGSHN
jgi:hypothetical protein